MIKTLAVIAILYIALLTFFILSTRQKNKDTATYFLAGSKLGSVIGIFTFAATLFSTFTIVGMPDLFRTHGVGSWTFLAFSDTGMVFAIISVGYYLRKKAKSENFKGLSGLMAQCYNNRYVSFITFLTVLIFLVPYVAIQIRGVAIFLHATFPDSLPIWGWATGMLVLILFYSEIGGLKAIIYNDMLQGLIMLIVICIIAFNCVSRFGNIANLFEKVEQVNTALLAIPGPKGLFTTQFLVVSFISIVMIPFTQPQVVTRIIIMKNYRSLFRMAIGLGIFALIIIFATMIIGLYGAVLYPKLDTAGFISSVLIVDQSPFIASCAIIGLIAAAISTCDSQLFALGGELRSLLKGKDSSMIKITRVAIIFFAIIVLIFSLITSDELVLLARTSFIGTSLLAPMIFTAIFSRVHLRMELPWATLAAIIVYIASLISVIPDNILGVRIDLMLMVVLALFSVLIYLFSQNRVKGKES